MADLLLAVKTDECSLPQRKTEMVRGVAVMSVVLWPDVFSCFIEYLSVGPVSLS